MTTTLVYAACFLALAGLSGLVAATGSRWAFRLPLIAATPLLALAVWWQLSQRDGLPTSSHPPDGSAFVAGVVQAPTPDNDGAVYLWAQPPNSATPRSYRLPFSSELEQQVAQAAKAAKSGQRVGVRSAAKSDAGKRQGTSRPWGGAKAGDGARRGGPRQGGARGLAGGNRSGSAVLTFYRLPAPRLAVKPGSG
jgi:hypothetical protein